MVLSSRAILRFWPLCGQRCLRARACLWSREGTPVGALESVQGGPVGPTFMWERWDSQICGPKEPKGEAALFGPTFYVGTWEHGIAKPGYEQRKVDRGLLEIYNNAANIPGMLTTSFKAYHTGP